MKKQADTIYRIYNKRTDSYERSTKKNSWNRISFIKDKLIELTKNTWKPRNLDDLEVHVFKITRIENMDVSTLISDRLIELDLKKKKENRLSEISKSIFQIVPNIHFMYQIIELHDSNVLAKNELLTSLINEYKLLNKK